MAKVEKVKREPLIEVLAMPRIVLWDSNGLLTSNILGETLLL